MWLLGAVGGGLLPPAAAADELETRFRQPPAETRPWVHWQWIDGNLSREGITADLEAMHRVGIGGATMMDATSDVPPGPVRFGTPEWSELVRHSLEEAARLGLEIGLHSSPGYTGLGGPWTAPEMSAQKLVWSLTNVAGPLRLNTRLPALPAFRGHSWDVALLAFPALPGDGGRIPGNVPRLTTDLRGTIPLTNLLDESLRTTAALPLPGGNRPFRLQLDYARPFSAHRLRLSERPGLNQSFRGVLQVSVDGRRFADLREFGKSAGTELVVNFHEVTGKAFRLVFNHLDPRLSELEFTDLDLSPVHEIPRFQAKSGLARRGEEAPIPAVPAESVIALDRLVNLTGRMTESGDLEWEVPPGRWTILRLGRMPVGRNIPSARPEALGLEADRLSPNMVERHFEAFLKPLIPPAGSPAAAALTLAHMDSWESGYQNWTPQFPEEFHRRRGYEVWPWLPTFTGRIVGSPEQSERFLWDVRRTVADLFADHTATHLGNLVRQHGLKLSVQSYFNGPFDDLQYGGRADVPSTEFWNETDEDAKYHLSKYMASVGHTTGRRVISAEAFSAWPANASWRNHPGEMKVLGDRAFCEGVNQFVIHCFTHQPWLDRAPGMTFGWWGVHYERTQTWWEHSAAWHDYLARCHALLREGHYVADLLYLTREGAYTDPPPRAQLQPPPPEGYHYDVIHPEVVQDRLAVKDGRLVLPDGMSYRLLVLPPEQTMTPALASKVAELVRAGAWILGPKPLKSPSLSGFPECDRQLTAIAEELWGVDATPGEKRVGNGRVIWGRPLANILRELEMEPDFLAMSATPAPLRWIHRRTGETDLYFVSNPSSTPVETDLRFRVAGRAPELWDPETGATRRTALWTTDGRRTTVRLRLAGTGALFVVFRQPVGAANAPWFAGQLPSANTLPEAGLDAGGRLTITATTAGIYRATNAAGRSFEARLSGLPKPVDLTGPWRVQFRNEPALRTEVEFSRLIPWNQHSQPAIRYYSGIAVYTASVHLEDDWFGLGRRLSLDLGDVQVTAQVELNGMKFPALWKQPYALDISEAARPGQNTLVIEVANLWVNRLIGDEQLPEDADWRHSPPGDTGTGLNRWPDWFLKQEPRPTERRAFASWKFYHKDSPLAPSGLLGPVRIAAAQEMEFREAPSQ